MIAAVINGGELPSLDASGTGSNGEWSEGYIEYCSNLGIIAGASQGTFAPDAKVTGTEAARMMLIALGYNATDGARDAVASADGNVGIVNMGQGNYGVIISAADISYEDDFDGSDNMSHTIKINKKLDRLLNISDAMIVH